MTPRRSATRRLSRSSRTDLFHSLGWAPAAPTQGKKLDQKARARRPAARSRLLSWCRTAPRPHPHRDRIRTVTASAPRPHRGRTREPDHVITRRQTVDRERGARHGRAPREEAGGYLRPDSRIPCDALEEKATDTLLGKSTSCDCTLRVSKTTTVRAAVLHDAAGTRCHAAEEGVQISSSQTHTLVERVRSGRGAGVEWSRSGRGAVAVRSSTTIADASERCRRSRAPAHGSFLPVRVEARPFGRVSQFLIELFCVGAAGAHPKE